MQGAPQHCYQHCSKLHNLFERLHMKVNVANVRRPLPARLLVIQSRKGDSYLAPLSSVIEIPDWNDVLVVHCTAGSDERVGRGA